MSGSTGGGHTGGSCSAGGPPSMVAYVRSMTVTLTTICLEKSFSLLSICQFSLL